MRVRIPKYLLWMVPLYLWSFFLGYYYGGYRWLYPIGMTMLFITGIWDHNRGEVPSEGPDN